LRVLVYTNTLAILKGIAIVYGVTFVAGLLFAIEMTPSGNPIGYFVAAVAMGALGVALAVHPIKTHRVRYLASIGVGLWLVSLSNVLLGLQTVPGWLSSFVSVLAMTTLGGALSSAMVAPSAEGHPAGHD